VIFTSPSGGRTSIAAMNSSGSGATKAQRHPTVAAISAPSGGPNKPGRIHIDASSAITRGRTRSG
jgi:hypothetical protein